MTRVTWARAAVLVLATRAGFLAVAAVAAVVTGADPEWQIWRRWDANLYLEIAEHGYHGEPTDQWAEAFLPLFPLLVRAVMVVGLPPLAAGMLVTTVASIVAVAYLLRFAEDAGAPSRRAALYLLAFPTAVFLVAAYTEAVFLAGAIPAFHHARRGEWGGAGIAAAVAAGTRVVGVFVLLGLAIRLAQQLAAANTGRGRLLARGAGALALGAAPVVGYLAWLGAVRGDPLFLLTAQREGWGRAPAAPWDAYETTLGAARAADGWLAVTWRLEILAVLVGVAVVVVALRRRDWDLAGFLAPSIAVVACSTWFYSVPRILLTFFPIALYLADWTGGSRLRHGLVLGAFVPLAALGTVAYTRAAWWF